VSTSLIVGGSKGIGLEIANTFKKRGDTTYVLSRNQNDWNDHFIQADLSDASTLTQAVSWIKKNKIHFNYLVFSQKNRMDPKSLEIETQVTLKATQYLVEQLIPDSMIEGGAVVFLGSPIAQLIMPDAPVAYHICRAAFEQLARFYAVKFGKYGITFNCVLPNTTVLKDANREFFNKNPKITDLLKKITPLQKVSEAQDVANAVSFFCSENARFISGQTLLVDGGQSLLAHEAIARQLVEVQ
jgi:NAD(P)-dependent dehydrogenase (short-subunit alcohol dehydrogenase family)